MHAKVFISHVDWIIKTPFVSYSDEKFIDELLTERQKKMIHKRIIYYHKNTMQVIQR